MNICVSSYFINNLNLNTLDVESKSRILHLIYLYILGIKDYTDVFKELKQFNIAYKFSKLLKILNSNFIKFCINKFRRYVKYGEFESQVSYKDKSYIKKYTTIGKKLGVWINRSLVTILSRIPKLNYVYYSYKPLVLKNSKSVYDSVRWDPSIGFSDIESQLSYKLCQNYNTYIFNFGANDFSENVFYSFIIRGIQSKKIDILRATYAKKNIRKSSVSWDAMVERKLDM